MILVLIVWTESFAVSDQLLLISLGSKLLTRRLVEIEGKNEFISKVWSMRILRLWWISFIMDNIDSFLALAEEFKLKGLDNKEQEVEDSIIKIVQNCPLLSKIVKNCPKLLKLSKLSKLSKDCQKLSTCQKLSKLSKYWFVSSSLWSNV